MRNARLAVVRRPLDSEALLVEIRAEQVRQGALLDRILAALARGRAPRDDADCRLLLAVLDKALGDSDLFTCTELVQHAQLAHPRLRDALLPRRLSIWPRGAWRAAPSAAGDPGRGCARGSRGSPLAGRRHLVACDCASQTVADCVGRGSCA